MAEEKTVDFIAIRQCIEDINDAIVEDMVGREVDLLPAGSKLVESDEIQSLWIAYYPIYRANTSIAFFFYLNDVEELVFVGAEQDGEAYFLTTDETTILEELWAWFELNLEFSNGEETVTEGEEEDNGYDEAGA